MGSVTSKRLYLGMQNSSTRVSVTSVMGTFLYLVWVLILNNIVGIEKFRLCDLFRVIFKIPGMVHCKNKIKMKISISASYEHRFIIFTFRTGEVNKIS